VCFEESSNEMEHGNTWNVGENCMIVLELRISVPSMAWLVCVVVGVVMKVEWKFMTR